MYSFLGKQKISFSVLGHISHSSLRSIFSIYLYCIMAFSAVPCFSSILLILGGGLGEGRGVAQINRVATPSNL